MIVNFNFMGAIAFSSQENQSFCAMINAIPKLLSFDCNCPLINNNCPCSRVSCATNHINSFGAQISGFIPTQIGQLIYLNYIDISSTFISGTIPTQIGQLTYLTYLDLFNGTHISGTIPTQIGYLLALTYIDVDNTQISGIIPTQIGNLVNLIYIDVDTTQISGPIPTQIGKLINLTKIEMEKTQISGTIPTQIGSLQYLSYLDVHGTQIGGIIPTQIGNLQYLTYLDLSGTKVCGCPNFSHIKYCEIDYCSCSLCPNYCSVCGAQYSCPPVNFTFPPIIPVPLSIIPVPYLSPVDCPGYNYNELFICKNGTWTSNSDVTLNGTYILSSKFDIPSLVINGDVFIQESKINLQNNLFLQKQSTMTIENSNITINGNFVAQFGSKIVINNVDYNHFSINVNQTAYVNGIVLILKATPSQANQRLSILSAHYINMTSIFAFINLTVPLPPCNIVSVDTEQELSFFIVTFKINNECSSGEWWIYVVIGISCLFLLFALIVSAIIIKKRFENREKKLDKLGNILQFTY